jgi:hypothetical protein
METVDPNIRMAIAMVVGFAIGAILLVMYLKKQGKL